MKIRKTLFSALFLTAALSIAGCGSSTVNFEPKESSVFVKKDGTVVSADIEDFAGENYSLEELTAYIEDNVIAFNTANGAEAKAYAEEKSETVLPVAIKSVEVKDEKASLLLDYANGETYVAFTGTAGLDGGINSLTVGTVADTDLSAVALTKTDGTSVSAEDAAKNAKYTVAIVDGPLCLQVEGEIVYVSSGLTVTGKNEVTTPSGAVSYVIFK